MTTALATLGSNGTALTAAQQAVLAELEQEQNAFDYQPARIKIAPGGINGFAVDTDLVKPPVRAIIAVSQKVRAWWPSKEGGNKPPVCKSNDGVAGIFDTDADLTDALAFPVAHPGLSSDGALFSCATCPLAQWGSNGKGQACKSMRRLLVLVDGWTMPAVLTLPPTSLRVFDTYASARARERGQAYFTTWTRIELTQQVNPTGKPYSVAKFTADGPLADVELFAVIDMRTKFADLVRSMDITSDDYDTEGATHANGAAHDEDMPF